MKDELFDPQHYELSDATQFRDGLDEETVERYREMYAENEKALPSIVLFRDDHDGSIFVADGFHRIAAFRRACPGSMMQADVRDGTLEDARRYAATANLRHGHPLTASERRRVFEYIISLPESRTKSVRVLGEELGCGHVTVKRIRDGLSVSNGTDAPVRTATRNGKTYTMDTSGIGRTKDSATPERMRPEPEDAEEEASLNANAARAEFVTDSEPDSEPEPEMPWHIQRLLEAFVHAVNVEKSTCFECRHAAFLSSRASPEDAAVMLRGFWGEETERFVAALAQEIREERR